MSEQTIDLATKTTNIFDIPNANALTCEIYGITPERPVLWIRATGKADKVRFDLVFRLAYLFDGPTQWLGANFYVAPREQQIALMKDLGWLDNIPPENFDEYVEHFRLIIVRAPHYLIRILTTGAAVSDGVPPEFTSHR